jgi:hypothetical protein
MILALEVSLSMGSTDEQVLSLDISENDFLYRIRRGSRVVYVNVLHDDLIPEDCRTDDFRILKTLRSLPRWDERWTTLTIIKLPNGNVESRPDQFHPHSLSLENLELFPGIQCHNLLNLRRIVCFSDRVIRVEHNGQFCILKIAEFEHQLRYLATEVKVFARLTARKFSKAPKFLGFVYEEVAERVIGFLMEDICGRSACIADLDACKTTLQRLHEIGIIHGDANRYNFIITESGARLIDFENATLYDQVIDEKAAREEMCGLATQLADESGKGRRVAYSY